MRDKEALLRDQLKNNVKSVERKMAYLISFPRDIEQKGLEIDDDIHSKITPLKVTRPVFH